RGKRRCWSSSPVRKLPIPAGIRSNSGHRKAGADDSGFYPDPQNALYVSAGMNVLKFPKGKP
ncbi:MAG: hypothetical protein ACE10H_09245, partial [Candidatus Binatia bacterium]